LGDKGLLLDNLVSQIDLILQSTEGGDGEVSRKINAAISPFIDNNVGTSNIQDYLKEQKEQKQREVNVRRLLEAKVAKLESMLKMGNERGKGSDVDGNIDKNIFLIEQLNEIRKESVELKKKILRLEITNQDLQMKKKSMENKLVKKSFRDNNPAHIVGGPRGGVAGAGGRGARGGMGGGAMSRTMSASEAIGQLREGGEGGRPQTSTGALPRV